MKSKIISLISLLATLLLFYSVIRLVFIAANFNELEIHSAQTALTIVLQGLRYDLSAIFMTNGVFLLLYMYPFRVSTSKIYQKVLTYLFIGVNAIFLALNCVDVVYFPFVDKRIQSDAFLFLNGQKGTEVYGLLPTFAIEFWYMFVFFGILIWSLFKIYKKTTKLGQYISFSMKDLAKYMGLVVIITVFSLLAIRGGVQLRPLSVINASEVADVRNAPAVLNSTFTIIKTLSKKRLQEVSFMDESLFTTCDIGRHEVASRQDSLQKLNIVIILVESLSKQYLSYYGGTAQTPFLDSLIDESFIFHNGFANARESIQGIPAVLASIPSLQDEPFIFSKYSANSLTSIASLLKPEGYTSSFYHGADKGTMGFYSFTKLAGFDHYYSKDDYPDDKEYDGTWGIWDAPFLIFMSSSLDKTPEPFVASVFTLNPHHPYKIPPQYKSHQEQKGHPIIPCITYIDTALKQFFDEAKTHDWYKNTLFVLTADHTGPNTDVMKTQMDEYRIPILFFRPDGSLKGSSEKIGNQIDIFPSIMSIIGYNKPYYSAGNDLFYGECPHTANYYKMGVYHHVNDTFYYQFNGEKGIGFYNWKEDKYLRKNLIYKKIYSEQIMKCDLALKKVIQNFNHNMIQNKMTLSANNK